MKKNPAVLILSVFTFFFFVVMAVAAMTYFGTRSESGVAAKPFGVRGTRLGVLEVNGVIMDSKKAIEKLERFEEDQRIKGVILRINSPGGAVAPSQEIYDAVKRLSAKKPVYASMGNLAASGGYYIACGAQKIFADAGTLTGSIGVIMQFMDMSKLYQWAKVSPYNIKTGKFKDIGSPDREMSPEEKALLQEVIDSVLGQFRRAVADGRKLSYEQVVAVSDGRIFSGEQAKAQKLVDELGGLQETATALVAEVKGEGKPILVYPRKDRRMLIEKLFDAGDDEDGFEGADSRSGLLLRVLALLLGGGQAHSAAALASAGLGEAFSQAGLMYLMPLGR